MNFVSFVPFVAIPLFSSLMNFVSFVLFVAIPLSELSLRFAALQVFLLLEPYSHKRHRSHKMSFLTCIFGAPKLISIASRWFAARK